MMTRMLSGVARYYARRAVRDAVDARYSRPSEADLAASALRADDAAFSAEQAARAHRWTDLVARTRDARLHSRRAHRLSRARASRPHGSGAGAQVSACSVGCGS